MRINTQTATLGIGLLTLSAATANAEIYSFDAIGEVVQFGTDCDGADAFPYAGHNEGDSMAFHFEYYTDAIAVSNGGFIAEYELAGNGSTMQFGDSIAAVETLMISVGEFPASGHGLLRFQAFNETLGISAYVYLRGSTPLAPALPTSLDFEDFTIETDMYANSDANQLLLPIVLGQLNDASVTPAPGSAAAMLGGLLLATRRRR